MKKTKVYDWNGVLITKDGFRNWLKETEPELFEKYFILGKEDKELKRRIRPQILAIHEEVVDQGVYPVELLPNVETRLDRDAQEGYNRTIFTSSPRKIIDNQN